MKKIRLQCGTIFIIDDVDYQVVSQYKWRKWSDNRTTYIRGNKPGQSKNSPVWLHRLILGAKKGQMVDHKDGDGLNNQRINIRICTSQQNNANRKPRGKSKYKGVCLAKWSRTGKKGILNSTNIGEPQSLKTGKHAYWEILN